MASEDDERREFFRITDHLLLEFRVASPEESQALEKTLKGADLLGAVSASNDESLAEEAAIRKSKLYAYLDRIDGKLDLVIELLTHRENRFHGGYQDVVISGSGLKFRSPTKMDAGGHLELRIGLPCSAGRPITALGRVVWSSSGQGSGAPEWETAVAFEAISEKDRDNLIAYIFSKERACLRTKQVP